MLLGADAFGRDEFSRLLFGGQISLAAGLLATLITLATAAVIGTVSGFYGGWIDESLMGTSELFLSLPWLYFLLGVRAFLPLHVSPAGTFLLLIAVIGLIGWARPARLVRGVVLSARTRNYVSAARGFGGSDLYLLRRHILPETFGVLLTQAALLVPLYVAAEVTFSFFGLGVSEPVPSWGNMLAALQQYSVLVSYGWLLAPAAALVVTSVIYGMLADALHSSKISLICGVLWGGVTMKALSSPSPSSVSVRGHVRGQRSGSSTSQSGEELARVEGVTGRYGGHLVVGQRSEPKTLNPVTMTDAISREVIGRLNADLIEINRASQKTEPALAKSWKMSPDGRTFTLQLRKGIRFSDGHPFDADDVVFSFAVYLDEAVDSPQRDLLIIDGKPPVITKLDQYTVRFTLPRPYAAAERLFDGFAMLPKHILEKPYRDGKFVQAWSLNTPPDEVVGLGPFRVKQYLPGQRIVLERNPYYWKTDRDNHRLPYLDELVFLFRGHRRRAGHALRGWRDRPHQSPEFRELRSAVERAVANRIAARRSWPQPGIQLSGVQPERPFGQEARQHRPQAGLVSGSEISAGGIRRGRSRFDRAAGVWDARHGPVGQRGPGQQAVGQPVPPASAAFA